MSGPRKKNSTAFALSILYISVNLRMEAAIQNNIPYSGLVPNKLNFNTKKRSKSKFVPDVNIYITSFGTYGAFNGKGCYAVIMTHKGHEKTISETYRYTSKTRMELFAIVAALKSLKMPCLNISIHLQNEGIYEAIKGRKPWRWVRHCKKGFVNDDLWWSFIELVKGHKYRLHLLSQNPDIIYSPRLEKLSKEAYFNRVPKIDSHIEEQNQVFA